MGEGESDGIRREEEGKDGVGEGGREGIRRVREGGDGEGERIG